MATLQHPLCFKFKLRNPPDKPESNSKPGERTTRSRTLVIHCKKAKNEEAFKEERRAHVDYDNGTHHVSVRVSGLRKSDLSKRNRMRVETDRFQKDWTISQVVEKIMALNRHDDVEVVLNRWAGRFARKNFPILIREITQKGSVEHSILAFSWMKNQKNYCARTDIYNMMIRLHSRHNQVDQARGLFFEMQKWRCKPDVETYNALINVHGRNGQWRWAMNIMEDMLRAAIPPSRSTYNNLIHACGCAGNWKEALKVCKSMTENGVGPDLVTHNIVLSAYKNGAEYSRALSYFELMKGTRIRPDTTTLNIVMHCQIKLGHYEKALEFFNSMRGKRAECLPDIVTFTTIMHMYSVLGQVENCKAVFSTILAEGLKPNVVSYNALLGAHASCGMCTEAYSIFKEMVQKGLRPDVVSYTSLLNAYGRSQQPEKAREILEMMKQNNCRPNLVSYNALIDAYGSNGHLAEAVKVLHEMENSGVQPNVVSISTLLAACARSGDRVRIESILAAAESRHIALNTIAYNSAIGSYMSLGEYEKAITLYRLMRKKRVKPDSVTFNVLISGSCKMSKFSDALDFVDEMMHLKIPLSQEGQLAGAESMFSMMKTAGFLPDVVAYTAMLHAYSVADNWENAFKIFQEMELDGVQPDSVAFSTLMRAFNRGCQPEKVLLAAEFMKDKNIPFTDAVLFEVISACSMLRDWRIITEVIKMMESSLAVVSVGTLNQLLQCVGKCGKVETMIKLFYKMVSFNVEVNLSTYSILLDNLLAAGNWRKYVEVLHWMEDEGIPPSMKMYHDILFFAQKSAGAEYGAAIRESIESMKWKRDNKISLNRTHESRPVPTNVVTVG
ncbi:OLC1v1036785C1 [Oldenlandia corymbosa var. corymbosa]|uniref:OLC1v1036785C1 n=1 Tax=Oldenlandia corymbosa var. corymbosa TaxID=529605 RepID=A0AAV1CZS8_OLDCO|nr:OLC1v1036785C1 [Oldenlandia corymbosa var. corymbosa]